MNDAWLIVTDIDGTLLTKDKNISERTARALRFFVRSQPGVVALASSRMPKSLDFVENEIGIECTKISYDGALIKTRNISPNDCRPWTNYRISPSDANDILTIAARAEYIGIYVDDMWLCESKNIWSAREERNTGVTPEIGGRSFLSLRKNVLKDGLHKIMVRGEGKGFLEIKHLLMNIEFQSAKIYSNSDSILEVLPKAASKGKAASELCVRLGIKSSCVMVFGDGYNDISMAEFFENSVAVANAVDELKEVARFSTGRGDEDGVAKFIESFFGV